MSETELKKIKHIQARIPVLTHITVKSTAAQHGLTIQDFLLDAIDLKLEDLKKSDKNKEE